MYLKSLRVQGFKTFASRTQLSFGRGITAIVGPNGSGKSNLVDAIRWALGERNARGLRGQRMEDVIYSGGPGRSGMGMAEVALVLDNQEQRLNVEFSEVEVSRRLYRSGEGEYLVNGSRARLKDIDALLASTGLRQEGYALTAQNDIDHVIQASPGERRELIEEAAGVRRLRRQREEALERLAQAQTDMRRAQDLLNELSPRADQLRLQAAAAEEYKRVANELKMLQGSLARDAWRKAMVQLKKVTQKEQGAAARRAQAETALASFAPEYEQRRQELAAIREDRWARQRQLADQKLELAEAQHQVRIVEERLRSTEEALQRAQSELGRLTLSQETARKLLLDLEREEQQVSLEIETVRGDLEERNLREKKLISELESVEGERVDLQSRWLAIDAERASADSERRRLEDRVAFLGDRKRELELESQAGEQRLESRRAELTTAERELEGLLTTFEVRLGQVQLLEEKIRAVSSLIEDAGRAETGLRGEIQALDSEARGLRAVRDRGLDPLRVEELARSGYNRLVELIEVEPSGRKAVETALEQSLSAWVADDYSSAENALAALLSVGPGRETVLFRSVPPAPGAVAGPRSLMRLIDCVSDLAPLLSRLVGDVVVVEDRAAARALLEEQPELRAVTPQGELITNFSVTAGDRSEAPLDTQARLNTVGMRLEACTFRLAQLGLQLETLRSQHAQLSTQQGIEKSELEVARRRQLEKASEVAALKAELERDQQQLSVQREQLDRLSPLLVEASRLSNEWLERVNAAEAGRQRLEQLKADLDERAGIVQRQVEASRERRRALELELALRDQRLKDLAAQRERAASSCSAQESEFVERQASVQALTERPSAILQEIDESRRKAADLEQVLLELEQAQPPDEARLAALESQLQADERRHVSLQVDLAHAEDALTTLKVEVSVARAEVERLAAELVGETVETGSDELVEDVDWQRTEREVGRLQRRLEAMGAVNLLAPQEFAELDSRCTSLTAQLADLQQAVQQLSELKSQLEDQVDERFRTVFHSVAANFQEFFAELFPGGRATLRLENDPEADRLDTGVEILAQTPGKRLQALSLLSGGERALTALAFLFALQAVNPSPFYVLDEVDAALDDANVVRFNRVLKRLAERQQFLIVTHNHSTMAQAEVLYGVTLGEHGISRLVSVRLENESAIPRLSERTA
jgi:chromosome segregation protein